MLYSPIHSLTGNLGRGGVLTPYLRRNRGAASGLLTDLVSYWTLDEGSGQRDDSHGSNHLTDNNTVGSAAGMIGNAADFEASASEYLSCADNPSLSVGDIDFTLAAWVNLEANDAFLTIASNYNGVVDLAFDVIYRGDFNGKFGIRVASGTGFANITTLYSDAPVSPATGGWHYVVAWHDSVADTINIQVDDGTAYSTAYPHGSYDGAGAFQIGGNGGAQFWDGLIDEVGFWKRVLTVDERTQLYNAGSGLEYPF